MIEKEQDAQICDKITATWLTGASVVPVFAAVYVLRTRREEQMMCETFGKQYRKYMRRTGRLFPRITRESVTHAQEDN